MGADDGVLGLGEGLAPVVDAVAPAVDVLAAVAGGHAVEQVLDFKLSLRPCSLRPAAGGAGWR